MKIAFCHHFDLDFGAGGEKFIIQTANELDKRGHEVSVFVTPFVIEGMHRIKDAHKMLNKGIEYAKSWHHKVDAEIAYVIYDPYSPINRIIFALTGCKTKIAGVHSISFWESPALMYGKTPNIGRVMQKVFGDFEFSRYDAVHTVTDCFPINHPRVYNIPNCVDSEVFYPKKKKADKFTVAFTSRHSHAKGWDVFLNASKKFEETDLLITDGSLSERELVENLSMSHVSVAPSLVDTFGYSIIESLMCETPVITTPLPAHKNLNVPLLYANAPGDIVHGVSYLKSMIETEPQKYRAVCSNVRTEAMKYDKKAMFDKFEAMLEEVRACCKC
jgi:glycosyltransferase involved in cell wall biosynthesis